jgi:hypothetical protein
MLLRTHEATSSSPQAGWPPHATSTQLARSRAKILRARHSCCRAEAGLSMDRHCSSQRVGAKQRQGTQQRMQRVGEATVNANALVDSLSRCGGISDSGVARRPRRVNADPSTSAVHAGACMCTLLAHCCPQRRAFSIGSKKNGTKIQT